MFEYNLDKSNLIFSSSELLSSLIRLVILQAVPVAETIKNSSANLNQRWDLNRYFKPSIQFMSSKRALFSKAFLAIDFNSSEFPCIRF